MADRMISDPAEREKVLTGYHDLVRTDVFDLVPKGEGALLDVGGGIGATSATLKHQGHAARVVVVDIVTEGFLPEVDNAFSGDLNDPAFLACIKAAEGSFDTILCLDVLEHLVDPWAVVKNLHGLLKPGGVVVASLPNMRFWSVSWGLFGHGRFDLTDKGHLDRTHMRWFVKKTAVELMTCSGLRLDRIIGKLPARRFQLYNALTLGRIRGLYEYQYLIRVSRND